MLGTKYTVKKDDTLWDLSNQFLGDPTKWPLIFSHNNSSPVVKVTGTSIAEQDVIHVGQVLYIPEKDTVTPTIPGSPIRYVHFKSKAKEYEKFKDSIFMRGVEAPITKIAIANVPKIESNSKKDKEYALRIKLARKISNEKILGFFTKLDSIPELAGAGVLYMDKDYTLVKIRPTKRSDKLMVFLREINQYDQLAAAASPAANNRVVMELLYAGLSCTGAALGYVAITAEGLTVPFSAGATSLLIPITTAATVASSASCGVYAGRVINEVSGNGKYNDYLDENVIFSNVMTALDIASLAGVAGAYKSAGTFVKQLSNKTLTKQTLLQRWKAMPRRDRKKLLRDIIQADNPAINNKQLKAILRSMDAPKIFSQLQIRKAMVGQLVSVIGATFSAGASATDGVLNNLAIAFIADEQKE